MELPFLYRHLPLDLYLACIVILHNNLPKAFYMAEFSLFLNRPGGPVIQNFQNSSIVFTNTQTNAQPFSPLGTGCGLCNFWYVLWLESWSGKRRYRWFSYCHFFYHYSIYNIYFQLCRTGSSHTKGWWC